jgi:hypothetical protein
MTMKRVPPFRFVLDQLEESPLAPRVRTRSMFGAFAVYVDERILFILRKKDDPKTSRDNGVWVASQPAHLTSLQQAFPELRPIEMFQREGRDGFSGWMNLPEDEEGFEEAVLRICTLVIGGDPRIGKVPKSKARKRS